jgi:alkyldihydroxyacetonephosphate synthase
MFDTDRKFWGWGVSSFPFPQPLLDRVRALLGARFGVAPPAARPAPELAAIRIPAPAIVVPAQFADIVTAERYHRAAHTYGKAFRDVVRALDGDFECAPDLVAYPRDEDDVARLLRWAGATGVAVIPFGGGSSVVGGVEADRETRGRFAGVLSLDLCRLDRVLAVDRVSRCARVQGGTYGPALEAQLKPHGYTLRHFPQSFEFSTVGGWIATRAGGHYATLYTHIDDFVESVRMVTPAGVLETRRLPGNGAGPQEDRLVLGSEGAFGVITEAWLRVQDTPRCRAGGTVSFATFEQGAAACRALAQSGLFPANARLIERDEAVFMGAGDGSHHILVLGFESALLPQDDKLSAALAICEASGGKARKAAAGGNAGGDDRASASDDSADQWKESFLRAPYLRDEIVRMGYVCETFETCTTWANFPALDAAVRAAAQSALQEHCGAGLVTCRFTHLYPDGPAPYYTIIAPSRPGRQLAQWDAIKDAVSRALIEQGGTITHHHAVGKDHRPYYLMQNAPLSLAMLEAAKRAVDPQGIMNPGTLLPPA